MATSGNECATPVFRPRKSHTKSRNGCLSCKQQRRKCDEIRPRCTRCSKRNVKCRYAVQGGQHGNDLSISNRDGGPSSPHLLAARAAGWPKASTILAAGLPPCLSVSSNGTSLADTLAATELDLLTRYLMHTSHIIPVDDVGVFALQIGIPNLAFGSAPLMDTIVSLAAVDRCHEILTSSELSNRDWNQLEDLLALAKHHYESSLHQTQGLSCNAEQHDNVLANATVMVLYGSAAHNIRIRMAECGVMAGRMIEDPSPASLQWVSLIRAAHTAYMGLLEYYRHEEPVNVSASDDDWPAIPYGFSSPGSESSSSVYPSRDGPTAQTRHLLQPIIFATAGFAFETLNERLGETLDLQDDWHTPYPSKSLLQSCSEAYRVLCEVLSVISTRSKPSSPESDGSPGSSPPQVQLTTVAPWLRKYVAGVTSAVPQPQLRRIIMSFLNRVPLEFLDLVRSILDGEPVDAEDRTASRLVLDIFAHWLVLVTLLDGVWWIGGIGQWELERAVSCFQANDPREHPDDEWWPARMLKTREELLGESQAPC